MKTSIHRTNHVPIPVNGIAPHDLNELRARHPDITDYEHQTISDLLISGLSMKQFADANNIPPYRIWQMFAKEHCIAYRNDLVRLCLGWSGVDALAVLRSLMDSPDDKVRFAAAKDIADRAGYGTQNTTVSSASAAVQVNIKL